MNIEVIYVEKVSWETIKKECKLPADDNNNGLTFGLHYIDFEGEGDIYETEWFKTEEERQATIDKDNLIVKFAD